jgi:hypothetical protein
MLVTHGPRLPTCVVQQVVGYLGYTGCDANILREAAPFRAGRAVEREDRLHRPLSR